MKTWAFILFMAMAFFVTGCDEFETVSGPQLMETTKYWKEPKVAIWYYLGSDPDYHYFHFKDLGVSKNYRVKRGEIVVESVFLFGKNVEKPRVMPWGPLALIKKET